MIRYYDIHCPLVAPWVLSATCYRKCGQTSPAPRHREYDSDSLYCTPGLGRPARMSSGGGVVGAADE